VGDRGICRALVVQARQAQPAFRLERRCESAGLRKSRSSPRFEMLSYLIVVLDVTLTENGLCVQKTERLMLLFCSIALPNTQTRALRKIRNAVLPTDAGPKEEHEKDGEDAIGARGQQDKRARDAGRGARGEDDNVEELREDAEPDDAAVARHVSGDERVAETNQHDREPEVAPMPGRARRDGFAEGDAEGPFRGEPDGKTDDEVEGRGGPEHERPPAMDGRDSSLASVSNCRV
jgi:hypothetical protein